MVRFVYINILVTSVENALCLKTVRLITTSDQISLKRRHIVRILRNGRRIKRVGLTEFA